MFIHRLCLYTSIALAAPLVAHAEEGAVDAVVYDFDDDLVQGDTTAPLGEVLQSRTRGARSSLIRVRDRWIVELCRSVEDL